MWEHIRAEFSSPKPRLRSSHCPGLGIKGLAGLSPGQALLYLLIFSQRMWGEAGVCGWQGTNSDSPVSSESSHTQSLPTPLVWRATSPPPQTPLPIAQPC